MPSSRGNANVFAPLHGAIQASSHLLSIKLQGHVTATLQNVLESYNRNSIVWFVVSKNTPLVVSKLQREVFTGLIRIHVLVHAFYEPIFGLAMMDELGCHGYRIGPGTFYPLLHGLERDGLLKSVLKNVSGRRRRIYRITAAGRRVLNKARVMVDELHHELHEKRPRKIVKSGDAL